MADVRSKTSIALAADFANSDGTPIVVNRTTAKIYILDSTGTVQEIVGSGGTVTVVDASFTGGLISIAGVPYSGAGLVAFTVAGTSGGIPYFSSGTTWASTGALTANQLVLGGGAGNPPTVLGSLGTTTQVLHGNAAGAPSFSAVSL